MDKSITKSSKNRSEPGLNARSIVNKKNELNIMVQYKILTLT